MNKIFILFLLVIFGCNNHKKTSEISIHDIIDNEISGDPLTIEIYNKGKNSIKIYSDYLQQYNEGNTLLYGGVNADLFDDYGKKTSVLFSDSSIVYNNTDSIKAMGNVIVESIKGFKLYAHEIILYNDIKLVKSETNIMFTSNDGDTLYGKGFWSNFDMSNSQILKPIGEFNNFK